MLACDILGTDAAQAEARRLYESADVGTSVLVRD